MSAIFLTGPAGTGKTTRAVTQLRQWLLEGVPGHQILVITPQRTLARPYQALIADPTLPGNGVVDILTCYGLALRTITLFWPLAAAQAGFARPQSPPVFLTIETAQYYLRQVLEPLLAQGFFDPGVVPVSLRLPRLMSQLLDNLNKAALIGLPHTQVAARLQASLSLTGGGQVALEQAQVALNRFRDFCLAHNLLDFSLQIELFAQYLWPLAQVRQHLTGRYRYLIADNLEEDTPFAHAILRDWLPLVESALLVNDEEAGYRLFLGANWRTAQALAAQCDQTLCLSQPYVASTEMLRLGERWGRIILRQPPLADEPTDTTPLVFESVRFYPQMVERAVERTAMLLAAGVPPGEVVLLAPFVSDALGQSFLERMKRRGLPAQARRPSRPLTDDPVAHAMLTLTRLVFPEPPLLPQPFDVAQALHTVIASLDPIRANLLTQVVYHPGERGDLLAPFEHITSEVRERISYQLGERFDKLRAWLLMAGAETAAPPLDHFLRRLFAEVLSQPGFAFHQSQAAAAAVSTLVESSRKFRRVVEQVPDLTGVTYPTVATINRAYLVLVAEGLVAAQYVADWGTNASEAILLTPVTTFLMSNRPVSYQVWLDVGSNGWWERIAQPLTHPYILAANWEEGRFWTDQEEVTAQRDRLYRLVLGLTRRCRKQIVALHAEIGEHGYEQRGELLMTLQQVLRSCDR